jgi:glycosyltransferase involved in cell wall biosynthesis
MGDDALRKRMGENGRQKSRLYSIEQVAPQWKNLFDKLMQKDEL